MIFCSLYSGSSGNSMFVSSKNSKILIDAGLPGKKIIEAIESINQTPDGIDGIFVTHEHSDHIKGVGVLSRKFDIPIYANDKTWCAMEGSIGKIKEKNIKIMDRRSTVEIGDMTIKSFVTPHDAIAPVGYTITDGNHKISVATDFGTFTEEIHSNIKDSDVILLESNHDISMLKYGPYPYNLKRRILSEVGHLSNDDCGKAIVDIAKSGLGKVIMLGHLSNTNNNPDLAYQTVLQTIQESGLEQGKDIILSLASRSNPSGYIEL